jgi:hypothetical protein
MRWALRLDGMEMRVLWGGVLSVCLSKAKRDRENESGRESERVCCCSLLLLLVVVVLGGWNVVLILVFSFL